MGHVAARFAKDRNVVGYDLMNEGSGRFGRRTATRIVVPKLRYPHGYRVRISGGGAPSRRDAPVLRVSARRRRVTVRIST